MAVDRAMKRFIRVCALTVGVVTLTQAAEAQTRVGPVARGRYRVETIAACGHCHTPQRLENNRQVIPGDNSVQEPKVRRLSS